jgi:hypothetical protein
LGLSSAALHGVPYFSEMRIASHSGWCGRYTLESDSAKNAHAIFHTKVENTSKLFKYSRSG